MTISHEALQNLYTDANFKVICANVFDEKGYLPNHITSSYVKEIEGSRILFVAATAPFTFYRALDWVVTDPLAAIKDEIEAHKGQFDILIVMSHVGVLMRNYAKKFLKLMSFSGVIHTITLKMVNLTMAYLWPQLEIWSFLRRSQPNHRTW